VYVCLDTCASGENEHQRCTSGALARLVRERKDKPLAHAPGQATRPGEARGGSPGHGGAGDHLTSVQSKPHCACPKESPLYKESILMHAISQTTTQSTKEVHKPQTNLQAPSTLVMPALGGPRQGIPSIRAAWATGQSWTSKQTNKQRNNHQTRQVLPRGSRPANSATSKAHITHIREHQRSRRAGVNVWPHLISTQTSGTWHQAPVTTGTQDSERGQKEDPCPCLPRPKWRAPSPKIGKVKPDQHRRKSTNS
jgi:hypothetical protein